MASEDDDFSINTKKLITEVQRRPILYDCGFRDYGDRTKKGKAWDEVCTVIIPNWENLSPTDRSTCVRDVQKRWRSSRDSFMKAYRKKTFSSESSESRSKPYVYYDRLTFMIPIIEKRRHPFHFQRDTVNEEKHAGDTNHSGPSSTLKTSPRKRPNSTIAKLDLSGQHQQLSEQIQEISKDVDEDSDKMFLLSLLPSFKMMDQDAKFATRIEMLRVIRRALKGQCATSPSRTEFPSRDHATSGSCCNQELDVAFDRNLHRFHRQQQATRVYVRNGGSLPASPRRISLTSDVSESSILF